MFAYSEEEEEVKDGEGERDEKDLASKKVD